jgi:hypothetical protein
LSNEIQIDVTLNDVTGPQKAKIKADLQAWAAGLPPVNVTATNPIDEAWQSEVDAGIKAAAGEPVDVQFTANFEAVQAEAEETFAAVRAAAGEPLAIGPADVSEFRVSALEAIAAVRAELELAMEAPLPPIYATATILGQSQGEEGNGQSPLAPGMLALPAGSTPAPSSFQPAYTPGPLFGGGQDPYAQARQDIADQTPIEIPVRAANPIDDAWLAQVKSSIRSIAGDALDIPLNADLVPFQTQLEQTLAELASTTRADIPVDVGDAMEFRLQVQELVAQVEEATRMVIDVQIDDGALTDLQAKTVAASQASLDLVNAEQKLNQAMASGNEDQIAKARQDVVTATKAESDASKELEVAMAAATESEVAAGAGAETAAVGMRSLESAMGPLWMVMNVAQIAMMALYPAMQSNSSASQDLSQQLIGLGQSGSQAVQQLTGNDALKAIAADLTGAGTSAAEFASAYSGSLSDAQAYTQKLINSQQQAGAATVTMSQQLAQGTAGGKAAGESMTASLQTTSTGVAQLAEKVNSGAVSMGSLSQANQDAVTHYNQLTQSVNSAKQALADMQAAQAVTLEQLFSSSGSFDTEAAGAKAFGLSLSDVEQAYDNIKLANPKDTLDQVAAAFDQNMASANQAASAITTAMQQEQQAVTQAQQAVDNAQHSAEQAAQSVASAQHAEGQAQEQYNNAVEAEVTAQQAVTAARAQAAQQLIDLTLQQKDAATAATSANLALYDAQQSAAALGVNAGNAQSFADLANNGGVNSGNEAQVKAALSLIQAQDQVADSQNSATQAQQALNTAQQQGIDNNPAVLSAQKALVQAQQQVEQAAYAEQQAHDQVSNALYAEQQASDALRTAKQQLTTAEDNLRDATDLSTQSGQQHMSMVLQLAGALRSSGLPEQQQYNDLINDTAAMFGGSTQAAANYLKQIGLINPDYKFGVTAVASVDLSQLVPLESSLHMSLNNLNTKAAGGPAGGLAVVGEQGPEVEQRPDGSARVLGQHGPEIADLATGSTVMPAANSAAMLRHFASGGVVGTNNLVGNNLGFGAMGVGYQDSVDALTIMGFAAPPSLSQYVPPPPIHIGGSLSGNRGANEQIMQQVFATMFGWTGQQWADAVTLEMMEAGFNNLAQNPTSTAFGMGQFLDGTWASYGIPKTSDPTLQSIAMGRYIESRYGSPAGALAHENAYHWYAAGGPANGWVGINDGGPEAVRLPNGSTVMPAANTAGLMQAPPPASEVTMTFAGNVNNAFAVLIMNLIRSNQVQLNVNGQRVRVG